MQRTAVIIALGIHLAAIGLAAMSAYAGFSLASNGFDRAFGVGFGLAVIALGLSVMLTMDRLCVIAACLLFPFALLAGGLTAPALLGIALGWLVVAIVRDDQRVKIPSTVLRYRTPIRVTGRLAGVASMAAATAVVAITFTSIPAPAPEIQKVPAGVSISYEI